MNLDAAQGLLGSCLVHAIFIFIASILLLMFFLVQGILDESCLDNHKPTGLFSDARVLIALFIVVIIRFFNFVVFLVYFLCYFNVVAWHDYPWKVEDIGNVR